MAHDKTRWFAQHALAELDWLDQNVMARRVDNSPSVEKHIDELRRLLLRLAGAAGDGEAYEDLYLPE